MRSGVGLNALAASLYFGNWRSLLKKGAAAAVVAAFGALTAAGAGGVPVSGTGFTSGNAAGHYQIVNGRITPTATGVAAGLNLSPYVIVLDNDQEVTLTTLAGEASVRTQLEAKAGLLAFSGGETLRYRNTGNMIPDTTLELARNKTYSSPVTITCETGARVQRLEIKDAVNLVVTGVEVHDDTGSGTVTGIALLGACDQITIQDNVIHGVERDPFGDYSAAGAYQNMAYGIATGETGGNHPLGYTIRRNNIYHCKQGIITATEGGAGVTITDNKISNTYTDAIQLAVLPGADNTPKDISRNYIRDFLGLTSDADAPHVDAIQFSSSAANAGMMMTGLTVRQNVIVSDGTSSRSVEAQGITMFNDPVSILTIKDAVVAGNVVLTKATNAVIFETIDGGTYVNNTTAVTALGAASNGAAAIELGGDGSSGTVYVQNNIAEVFALQGNATYVTLGNVAMGDEGSTLAYADVFVGPTFTDPITFDQIKSRYAMKPGGPADHGGQNAGAIGSGYGAIGEPMVPANWNFDPAYEVMTPAVIPPPHTSVVWYDYLDAATLTMDGATIAQIDDKQGSGVNVAFAVGSRPELVNNRVGLFTGGERGTFTGTLTISHRAHTILHFGHMAGDGDLQGWLSGNSSFFVFGNNNASPAKGYYYSGGNVAGTNVELPHDNFSTPWNESGLFGAVAYYGVGDAASATLGNGETSDTLAALADQTSTATYYGSWIDGSAAQNMKGRVLGTMVFDRALNATELAQMLDWARGYYGTYDDTAQDKVIICHGDSLTNGYGPSNIVLDAYPAQLGSSYDLAGARLVNTGANGDTISNDTAVPRVTGALTTFSAFTERKVVFWLGTNDLWNNDSAATIIANLDTAIATVRAHDPSAIIIGCTIINRQADKPARAAVNTHIRSVADFDSVVDLDADARFADAYDATYRIGDNEGHLTRAGYAVAAELIQAAA